MMSTATIFLYIVTPLFAGLCAIKATSGKRINFAWASLSFLILWQLLAFSNVSADQETYNMLFEYALDWPYVVGYHDIEVGFACINSLVRFFTSNVNIYNALLSFIFLILIFSAFYRMKDLLDFGWSVFVFSCIFYLQYLNLKRIYLASAICLFGMSFLVRNRKWQYGLCVAIASFIHGSALIMFIPLLINVLRLDKLNRYILLACGVAAIIVIYIGKTFIFQLVSYSRYTGYKMEDTGFGIMQLVYHFPLFFIFLRYWNTEKRELIELSYILAICSFVLGSCGYFMPIIGRTMVYFALPFCAMFSVMDDFRNEGERSIIEIGRYQIEQYKVYKAFIVLYCILRLYIYIKTMAFPDGIMPYINIFGMEF